MESGDTVPLTTQLGQGHEEEKEMAPSESVLHTVPYLKMPVASSISPNIIFVTKPGYRTMFKEEHNHRRQKVWVLRNYQRLWKQRTTVGRRLFGVI